MEKARQMLIDICEFTPTETLLSVEQKKQLRSLHKKITATHRPFIIAFCGVFSSGKTSLINHLLSCDYQLPTGINPITKIVTRIRYGAELTFSYFDGERYVRINQSETQDIIKGLKSVESPEPELLITMPSELLKKNVEIIDTPGLDDEQELEKITRVAAFQADMSVVCCSALQLGKMSEMNLIQSLDSLYGNFCLAITRADNLNTKRERCDIIEKGRILVSNKGNAAGAFCKDKRRFFLIDNSEESGDVSEVKEYLNSILDNDGFRELIQTVTDQRMSRALLKETYPTIELAKKELLQESILLNLANESEIRKRKEDDIRKQIEYKQKAEEMTTKVQSLAYKYVEVFRRYIADFQTASSFQKDATTVAIAISERLIGEIAEYGNKNELCEKRTIERSLKKACSNINNLIPAPTGHYEETRGMVGRTLLTMLNILAFDPEVDDGKEWIWDDFHIPAVKAFQNGLVEKIIEEWNILLSKIGEKILQPQYYGSEEDRLNELNKQIRYCEQLLVQAGEICLWLEK